jgi:hypothetical protein
MIADTSADLGGLAGAFAFHAVCMALDAFLLGRAKASQVA